MDHVIRVSFFSYSFLLFLTKLVTLHIVLEKTENRSFLCVLCVWCFKKVKKDCLKINTEKVGKKWERTKKNV